MTHVDIELTSVVSFRVNLTHDSCQVCLSIRKQQQSSSLENSNSPLTYFASSSSYMRPDGHHHHNRLRRQTSNIFSKFDQKQIIEFKETFALLDVDGDGYIDREDLRDMLASLGQAPTDAYIDTMLADSTSGNSINFATFLTMMANKLSATDSEEELLRAFSNLEEGGELNSGIINTTKLRDILATRGERLTDEEGIDDSENFDYREFVKTLKHGHMDGE
ncbi:9031_t:CDS:2 [Ambispora leptoticha]|uniref:9031_t:CDS:1 n=1 Tax=Ambispora leptoticha TaxID=144679 RepID=A0A9N9GMG2_9GLOM|nr:9031_t:CDS:2 [Ambispora leptoticha]